MIVQIIFIVIGILLLLVSIFSLAKGKMTETILLAWAFVALMFILAGILLRPLEWQRYISKTALILFSLVGMCLLFCGYFVSCKTSELIRKNNALSVELTLLKKRVEDLEKEQERKANEEASVRD